MEELIIKLTSLLASDYYDERHFNTILVAIKEYFNADKIEIDYSKEEEKSNELNQIEKLGYFRIYNPKKPIDKFMRDYLTVYSQTLTNIYLTWNKSRKDELTGVYNNNALNEKIKDNKEFNNVGIAFVDANGLGVINNTYGHEAGDKLLKTIAEALYTSFRKRDVFRKGGDEFVIIAENIPEEIFNEKINKVREYISNTPYSASIGSIHVEYTNNIKNDIKKADEIMYVEKEEYRKNNQDKYTVSHVIKRV